MPAPAFIGEGASRAGKPTGCAFSLYDNFMIILQFQQIENPWPQG
jgi:hypothetical protein